MREHFRPKSILLLSILVVLAVIAYSTREPSSNQPAKSVVSLEREDLGEEEPGNLMKRNGEPELPSTPLLPGSMGGAEDEGDEEDEDSELMPVPEMTPAIVVATPPAAATPSAKVVKPKERIPDGVRPKEEIEDEESRTPSTGIMDALMELERNQGRSPLIGGVRVGGGRDVREDDEQDTKGEDEEDDSELSSKFTGQPRGFVILPLMLPRARESVEKQVETMLRSGVQSLYVSFLADKIFDFDIEYASSVVQRLAAEGRSLTLEVYFTSGPTMRRYDETPVTTPFIMDPFVFRYLISEDRDFQSKYRHLVESIKPIFVQNKNAGKDNHNLACVMLEDNLDLDSYMKMREQTKQVLGDLASFVRNPCPNCGIPGSDTDGAGDALEFHVPEKLPEMDARGGITFDGTGYSYPGETGGGRVSFDQMKAFSSNAAAKGIRFVGLWRADRQGLGPNRGDQLLHPDERSYAVPSEEQVQWDIELLRAGLKPVR